MNWTVSAALYGYVPLVAILFASLAPARAAIVAYLIGWLFLPVVDIEVFGFFDLSKGTAVPLTVFAAVLAFDSGRVLRFRPSLVDLPIAVFCMVPMASSITNDLGTHDAFSAPLYQTIRWGLPYLTGRLYFSSAQGLQQLALGVVAGGLIYAPLCWWEIRMSPQLHATLFGFHQHNFGQTLRGGGYRPMVFMDHGLMLGLWMGAASLVGLVLWRAGTVRKISGIPLWLAVPVLLVTLVLCKSFGALLLVLMGVAVLWAARGLRTSLPMALLVCIPPAYVATRTLGGWSGSSLSELVSEVDRDRAQSLAFRLDAEEALRVKAAEQPLFGWGGFGRSFVRRFDDSRSSDTVVTDSLWIIVFGKYGFVGLISLLASFIVPVAVLARRCPARAWSRPDAACAWALATVLTLYALDSLVNAMVNPLYFVIAGAVGDSRPRPPESPRPARPHARFLLRVPARPMVSTSTSSASTKSARLLVAIVNYRTPELTIACLRSVEPEVRALGDTRVVVSDNASGDGSAARIREAIADNGWASWASLLALDRNGGFSYGNNAAIGPALEWDEPPDYFLLLNSDTEVRPGALRALIEFMDTRPDVGIAGSRLEDPDGTHQHSRYRFHSFWSELESGIRLGVITRMLRSRVVAPPLVDTPHPIDWVAGASMIIRREVFEDVGLLDSNYFLYFEEVDFCLNARRAGWTCWYVPQSRVMHFVGKSSGITNSPEDRTRRPRYWFESRQRYFVKNYGRLYAWCANVVWAAGFAVWRMRRLVQGKPDNDPPHMLWDFVRFSRLSSRSAH